MTPLWNQRVGREPPRPRWGPSDQRIKLPKCPSTSPRQPLPLYPQRPKPRKPLTDFMHSESPAFHWEDPLVSKASGYHSRHAESSPVRPRIVTVVRPCGNDVVRKISLLLNRRAVQTFEQLIADVSEALGFPCWNNSRIRRLFSSAGREIHSLTDFFRFDNAFLAFGNSRPTLEDVISALEELFPENPVHCEHLSRIWERILRPKATKADSGFHDEDPKGHIVSPNQQVNQPVNNLQPIGKQKDKTKRERQRELRRRKEEENDAKKQEKKKEAVYCRSCRGQGLPIPPIRPNKQGNESDIISSTQLVKLVANPNSSTSNPQKKDVESKTEHEESVEKKTSHAKIPPDGAEVSMEEIERCYSLGRVVGDGNFAVVRECHVKGLTETFAMKIVDSAKLQGRGHMIQNEIALLRSLKHPRLIQLFRSHHTNTHVYLLMELVDGGDLFDAITQSGRFPEPSAACMVHDISLALEYIHNKSIAHRDIKPENLLVQRQNNGTFNLKLADFGLAMVVTEPVFTVCGTPTYVAPEILAETGYGVGVDVWAMGVILFVLLSGFPPFRSPERNQEELFCLIQKGDVHFLSPYWDNVSEGAKSLVKALLEVNPKKRLTASQTLQHDWLQQKERKVETEKQKFTEEQTSSSDSHKEESANNHHKTPNAKYGAGETLQDKKHRIKETSAEDSSVGELCITDQHKPDRPAQQELKDTKQDRAVER